MIWARLKVVPDKEGGKVLEERVFNLSQLQWWIGHGDVAQLQFAGSGPIYVEMRDKRLEMLTGSSGHYASDSNPPCRRLPDKLRVRQPHRFLLNRPDS